MYKKQIQVAQAIKLFTIASIGIITGILFVVFQ